MSGVELKANDVLKGSNLATAPAVKRRSVFSSLRFLPVLFTVAAVCVAAALGWQAWQYYMGSAMDARRHGPRLCRENRP